MSKLHELLDQSNEVAIKEQLQFLINAAQRHGCSLPRVALVLPLWSH